jgi:hypothetical protein
MVTNKEGSRFGLWIELCSVSQLFVCCRFVHFTCHDSSTVLVGWTQGGKR